MKRKLRIIFTSDMHGHFFPTDYISEGEKPVGLIAMGAQFQKDENTLVIDGGDTLQGSPFTYYAAHEGRIGAISDMLNACGYDYAVPGNHDFNYGREAMKTYFGGLNAKILAANVFDKKGEIPFLPGVVHTMPSGLRVGIIGIVSDWVNKWEKAQNLEFLQVTDTLEAAKRAYREIEGKCDVTVCVYHGGVERNLESGEMLSASTENIACRIIDELPFDIMLTGHQHIPMENKAWKGTHIVQNPPNSTHFACITWEEGEKAQSRLIPAVPGGSAPESVLETEALVQKWLDTPISYLSDEMTPEEPLAMALHGTPIANLFNHVQQKLSGAMLSSTSLANEVRGFHKTVTVRDVVSTYIYPNTLSVLKITGSVLKEMLENCASYFAVDENGRACVSEKFLKPKVSHYNYDFLSGIEYAFEITNPVGSRVTKILYQNRPVQSDDEFTLCVNNYRATGVGGYDSLAACPHEKEILTEMSEILLDFFAANKFVQADFSRAYRVFMNGTEL